MSLSDNQTNLMSLWGHMRRGFETPLQDSHVKFRVLRGIYSAEGLIGTVRGDDGYLYKVIMTVISEREGQGLTHLKKGES